MSRNPVRVSAEPRKLLERVARQEFAMASENVGTGQVTFGRGHSVWIMAIDGTWPRSSVLNGLSATDAELTLEGSIEGLNLKEFFLLLSSSGLAYRRCGLVRVTRASVDIRYIKTKKGQLFGARARENTTTSWPRTAASPGRPARSGRKRGVQPGGESVVCPSLR